MVVIPVAGKGTRAMPLTGYGAVLKPFINATEGGATVLEEIVREIGNSGLSDISIIVGKERDKDVFRDFFTPFDTDPGLKDKLRAKGLFEDIGFIEELSSFNVHFFVQSSAKGFGDAIARVCPRMERERKLGIRYRGVVVVLGDDMVYSDTPCCKQIVSAHHLTGSMVVAVQRVSYEEAKKFGVVLVDTSRGAVRPGDGFSGRAAYNVIDVEEKPDDPTPNMIKGEECYFAVLGRYVLNEEDVRYLAGQDGSPDDELDFTSLFRKNFEMERLVAVEVEGDWHTVGSSLAAQKAIIKYGIGQCGKDGRKGRDGVRLAQYAIEVMKEKGIIGAGVNIKT